MQNVVTINKVPVLRLRSGRCPTVASVFRGVQRPWTYLRSFTASPSSHSTAL
jgi:hypothetical protein